MSKSMNDFVRRRANGLCEYCQLPQSASEMAHEIDHVIATQHDGKTELDNLALSCIRCNLSKGPNIAGLDPLTKTLCPLFNPRSDVWDAHFRWEGPILVGITPVGRATVKVLAINAPARVAMRQVLIDLGQFPPAV